MRAWWEQLAEREQRLVLICGGLTLLAILYWGLWAPISAAAASRAQQLVNTERDLAWLKVQAETVLAAGPQTAAGAIDSGALTKVVNETARRHNITISRLQPQGNGLQVWIDEVSWSSLLALLEQLQRDHGIVVNSVDLARSDNGGRVKVRRLELTRG